MNSTGPLIIERRRRGSHKAELKSRVVHHWPTTLLGIGAGLFDFFFEVVHGSAEIIKAIPDPTSMPWEELQLRICKALLITAMGAAIRFRRSREVNQ